MVRTRPVEAKDLQLYGEKRPDGSPGEARAALLFALREITGKDLGTTARDWKPVVEAKMIATADGPRSEDQVGSDWKQFVIAASAEPDLSNEADARRLKRDLLAATGTEQEKLLSQLADAKGLPYTDALAEATARLRGPAQMRARDLLAGRLSRMTDTTLRERLGEDEAEMRRAAARAVGLLGMMYMGVTPANRDLLDGVEVIKKHPPGRTNNVYYEYYATQVMHHMGGDAWQFWNLGPDGKSGIRDTLIAKQDKGQDPKHVHQNGSWEGSNGRIMTTSLNLLSLEVYYRHLPLYRRELATVKEEK